jgi:hypothetical protein
MKTLGTKYGINITKPWNQDMYTHNEKIGEIMKTNIKKALIKAYSEDDEKSLREISKAVVAHGYGSGYGVNEIYDETILGIENSENYWLNGEYPDLVRDGYVPELLEDMVGY